MYFGLPSYGLPEYGIPLFGIPSTTSVSDGNSNIYVINFNFNIFNNESIITPDLYKYVSDKYGLVYKNIQNSYAEIDNAVKHIARIDNVEAKLELLKPLRQSSKIFQQNKFISQLYAATITINTHVKDKSEDHDLNLWLEANEVKVLPEWASLCQETGITISSSNIVS